MVIQAVITLLLSLLHLMDWNLKVSVIVDYNITLVLSILDDIRSLAGQLVGSATDRVKSEVKAQTATSLTSWPSG